MEAVKNLDHFDDLTVANTIDKKIDYVEAKKIKAMREQIVGLIDQTCGNREQKKRQEFESRLNQELKSGSIDGLNMLNTAVEVYRDNVSKTVEKYFSEIDKSHYDHLFVNRPGRDARKLYKEEFLKLNDAERAKRLAEFAAYMAEQQKTYEELIAYVSPETVARLRRSERTRLLLYVKGCGRLLHDNKELFAENEIAEIKAEMADCTSPADQQKLMTKVAGQLEQRKWYKNVYSRLPLKYQQMWGKIDTMSLEQRKTRYEKLVVRIEEEYEHVLDNHPDRKHIGAKDRAAALAYVRSDQVSGGDKFRALKNLEKQIQKQKKEVSDPFENALRELSDYQSPREIKKLRDEFYDAQTYNERVQLAQKINGTLLEAQAESQEQKELSKEYAKKLEADKSVKIISPKTQKEALKRWEKRTLEEMREILNSVYQPDRQRRLKVLQQFQQLPKQIQNKNIDFYELTHTERVMRMEELSQYEEPTTEKQDPQSPEKQQPEKAKIQDEKVTESNELDETQHIEKLMAQAATATRTQKYEYAIQCYEKILNIDPYDELARLSLKFVQGKFHQPARPTNQKEALSDTEKNQLKQATNEALKASPVMQKRRRNTITEELNYNLERSQAKHGSNDLEGKIKNMSDDEKQLAQQVLEQSGKNKMLVDGEATDVIWYNDQGYRDLSDKSNELKVEKQIASEGSGNHIMDNIVTHKSDGTISNAENARRNLKKRESETKNLIKSIAKKKLKTGDDKADLIDEALNDEINKKDLSVKLRAA